MTIFNRSRRTPFLALGKKVLFFTFTSAALAACGDEKVSIEPPVNLTVDCQKNETPPAPVKTQFTYSLSAAKTETASPSKAEIKIRGELLPTSLAADGYFRYDVYVLTAQESGKVTITSDVIAANPDGYRYGYAYPLSLSRIETGATLNAYGYNYLKNALDDGHAITEYTLEAGKQYALVYKSFDKFTPLTYELTLPDSVQVEGYVTSLTTPVADPTADDSPISLTNPRPKSLDRIVTQIQSRIGL